MQKKTERLLFEVLIVIVGAGALYFLVPNLIARNTEKLVEVAEKSAERSHQQAIMRERELQAIREQERNSARREAEILETKKKAEQAGCDYFNSLWLKIPAATDYCDGVTNEQQLIDCSNRFVRARRQFWEDFPDSKKCPQIWGMHHAG